MNSAVDHNSTNRSVHTQGAPGTLPLATCAMATSVAYPGYLRAAQGRVQAHGLGLGEWDRTTEIFHVRVCSLRHHSSMAEMLKKIAPMPTTTAPGQYSRRHTA